MDVSPQSQARTRLFARALGPFLIIADATAVARASDMQALLSQFEANSLWTWVTGAFILLFGLFVVAAHPYWRGAAAITVSLLGWLITLRGLLLFAFPQAFVAAANGMIGRQGWWVAACVIFALVGVYLTYAGWVPVGGKPRTQAAQTSPDFRRAA
jgi:hypothetical protein